MWDILKNRQIKWNAWNVIYIVSHIGDLVLSRTFRQPGLCLFKAFFFPLVFEFTWQASAVSFYSGTDSQCELTKWRGPIFRTLFVESIVSWKQKWHSARSKGFCTRPENKMIWYKCGVIRWNTVFSILNFLKCWTKTNNCRSQLISNNTDVCICKTPTSRSTIRFRLRHFLFPGGDYSGERTKRKSKAVFDFNNWDWSFTYEQMRRPSSSSRLRKCSMRWRWSSSPLFTGAQASTFDIQIWKNTSGNIL